jgi:hypothetical protein
LATSLITQNNLVLKSLCGSAALTIPYVTSEVMNIQGANQVQLLVCFTKGNSTGCRLKIEFSEDRAIWYQESTVSELPVVNEVEHKLVIRRINETGNYVISIPVSASYLKVSFQAIDSGEGTLLSIKATAANI